MPFADYEHIRDSKQLLDFCDQIAGERIIAFDTEFISENSYLPELCLIQVAAGEHLAVIDPLATDDVRPFWEVLAAEGHITVVHAGREELRFCRKAIGRAPAGWFDTQLAAGFVGMEYPAAYGTLISRILDKTLPKGETRTDWRRRPLSNRHLDYALQDVIYLAKITERLTEQIETLGRRQWLEEELLAWQKQVEDYDSEERWVRVSGISGLSRRSLAIVRELWRWRDNEARRRDRPAKHVLRDDLIVYSGNDEVFLSALNLGAKGGIGLTYNFMPQVYAGIYQAFMSDDIRRARELQWKACAMIDACFQVYGMGVAKAALQHLGFDVGEPRRPLRALTPDEILLIVERMDALSLSK